MSNIAIKGAATGTGVFTLESPATNTNRTLTLPDVTATVITDSAGVLNIGSGQVYKDASGNVGIGVSSPIEQLTIGGNGSQGRIGFNTTGVDHPYMQMTQYGSPNTTVTVRIDAGGDSYFKGGNLLVGYSTPINSNALLQGFSNVTTNSTPAIVWGTSAGFLCGALLNVDNQGWGAAGTAMVIGKVNGTGRSINAAGTLNASGADYAEYMVKAGDFTIAKGDVVGVNADGKLTNVFSNSIAFVVKSTDPSYVGGDTWGNKEVLGLDRPAEPTADASDEEKAQYALAKQAFDTAFELAREKVDRIAFSGQVPVNVIGATAGQYIVPTDDNDAIKGVAVSNPTFEQYQQAVGKVIAIESDGRARIIVKVA